MRSPSWAPLLISDNLIPMKEISATEAARGFAGLMDAVEHHGESFVVRRNGRVIARIAPADGASGRTVKDLLGTSSADTAWAEGLRELRRLLPAEVSGWRA
jgi:antitoxin (DNA-binding transcriptional repressor) of toxin-antitoxin stability system